MTQNGRSGHLVVEQPVNALLGLGHSLFLPECQGTQGRSRKQGQVSSRGIDAHAPLGPLPVRHNVISAISPGFRVHEWASLVAGPRLKLTWQHQQRFGKHSAAPLPADDDLVQCRKVDSPSLPARTMSSMVLRAERWRERSAIRNLALRPYRVGEKSDDISCDILPRA